MLRENQVFCSWKLLKDILIWSNIVLLGLTSLVLLLAAHTREIIMVLFIAVAPKNSVLFAIAGLV